MTDREATTTGEASVPITRLRLGIIGCADIAKKICAAIKVSSNVQLVALASRSMTKAQQFAQENNLYDTTEGQQEGNEQGQQSQLRLYDNYQSVLDDPNVQAVYIPLPTLLHLEWVIKTAKAKKHILIEKPVAVTSTDFLQMLEICRENEVFLMDGTMFVHHPRTELLRQTLREQSCGPLHRVQTCLTFPADENFFQNNIRTKADADPLGAIGDLGEGPSDSLCLSLSLSLSLCLSISVCLSLSVSLSP
jgi:predicted dehydrogenase